MANGPWQASNTVLASAVLIFFLAYLHMCRAWIYETLVPRWKKGLAMTVQLLCLVFLCLPSPSHTTHVKPLSTQTINAVQHAASDYFFASDLAIGFSLAVVLALMPLQFYLCIARKKPSPFA